MSFFRNLFNRAVTDGTAIRLYRARIYWFCIRILDRAFCAVIRNEVRDLLFLLGHQIAGTCPRSMVMMFRWSTIRRVGSGGSRLPVILFFVLGAPGIVSLHIFLFFGCKFGQVANEQNQFPAIFRCV